MAVVRSRMVLCALHVQHARPSASDRKAVT